MSGNERPVIRRASEDVQAGRLWKARDRLCGALRHTPTDQTILRMLGDVCYQMGDLPEAARYWYLTELRDARLEHALEALQSRYGAGTLGLARALPVRAKPAEYPPAVAARLEEVGKEHDWAAARWSWAAARRTRDTAKSQIETRTRWQRLTDPLVVALLIASTIGVWAVGIASLIYWIWS